MREKKIINKKSVDNVRMSESKNRNKTFSVQKVLSEIGAVHVRAEGKRPISLAKHVSGFSGKASDFYLKNALKVEGRLAKMSVPNTNHFYIPGKKKNKWVKLSTKHFKNVRNRLLLLRSNARLYKTFTKKQLIDQLKKMSLKLFSNKKERKAFLRGFSSLRKHAIRNKLVASTKKRAVLKEIVSAIQSEGKIKSIFDQKANIRTFFVNDLNLMAEETENVLELVRERLDDAKEKGASALSEVYIVLTFKPSDDSTQWSSKKFGAYELRTAVINFLSDLQHFVETDVRSTRYEHPIAGITVRVVQESSGGCNESGKCGSKRALDFTLINPRSTKNNCFFACLPELVVDQKTMVKVGEVRKSVKRRLSAKSCNALRAKYKIPVNSPVPCSIALKMFTDRFPDKDIEIVNMDTKRIVKSWKGDDEPKKLTRLHLYKGHYKRLLDTPRMKCEQCGKKYIKNHKCNEKRVSFYQKRVIDDPQGKYRSIHIAKKINQTAKNEEKYIVDYDIETHVIRHKGGNIKEHIPFCVGFVYRGVYDKFTGLDCMDKFWVWLKKKNEEVDKELEARLHAAWVRPEEGDINQRFVEEIIDYDILERLVACKNIPSSQKSILKKIKQSYDAGSITVDANLLEIDDSSKFRMRLVPYKNKGLAGTRLYPENHAGIGTIKSIYRNLLVRKYAHDIDIVNCHFTLLAKVFKDYSIKHPALKKYNKNRKDILKKVWKYYDLDNTNMSYKSKRGVAKTLFIKIGYGGNLDYLSKDFYDDCFGEKLNKNVLAENVFKKAYNKKTLHPFLKSFFNETSKNVETLMSRNLEIKKETQEYNLEKGSQKVSGNNLKKSALSTLFQRHENSVLNAMIDFFKSKNIPVTCLQYDGLHVVYNLKEMDKLLLEAEAYIARKTGFMIKLSEKSMWWKSDTTWAEENLNLKSSIKYKPRRNPQRIYVNAYHGSGFDHFKVKEAMINAGDKSDCIWMSGNTRINKMRFKRLDFIDLARHMTGSLKSNLKEWDCKIQKGDYDHDRSKGGWEKMDKDARRDCLKYLKSDVLGLAELRRKKNDSCVKMHKMNIYKTISSSAFSWACWKREGMASYNQQGWLKRNKSHVVQLPNIEMDKFFRKAIKGGRTYMNKKTFISKQREAFLNGEISFDELTDYLIDADAVSLYPCAMLNELPVGYCKRLEKGECKMRGKMGIYKCNVKTNKFLLHSISACRTKSGLSWNLNDKIDAHLTSIEIEDMIKAGHTIEIKDGYYWEETAPVFKSYIEKLFKTKKQAKKGSGAYATAKINMNGLYGKNIQNPIYDKLVEFSKNHEYWAIRSDYDVNGLHELKDKQGNTTNWIAECKSKDPQKILSKITKPSQYGAFILAYSRRIMLKYMYESNPHFDLYKSNGSVQEQLENDIFYQDTDSAQMHARNIVKIKNYKDSATELGMLSNDLKGEGKILRGIWIAPKLYALEYVKRGSKELHLEYVKRGSKELYYHMRGKGLDNSKLSWKMYEEMLAGKEQSNTRGFSIRPQGFKIPSTAASLPKFSLRMYVGEKDKKTLTRIVNRKPWSGRAFSRDGNSSLPWGYAGVTRESALSFAASVLKSHGKVIEYSHFKKLATSKFLPVDLDKRSKKIFIQAAWSLLNHEGEQIRALTSNHDVQSVKQPHKQQLSDILCTEVDMAHTEKSRKEAAARSAREKQRAIFRSDFKDKNGRFLYGVRCCSKCKGIGKLGITVKGGLTSSDWMSIEEGKKTAKKRLCRNCAPEQKQLIYYWNVNGAGLKAKQKRPIDIVKKIILQDNPLAFGVSEPKTADRVTWPKFKGYDMKRSGKLLVYAAKAAKIEIISPNLIRVELDACKILFTYRSPSKGIEVLKRASTYSNHTIIGDLNAHSTKWGAECSNRAGRFIDSLSSHVRLQSTRDLPTFKRVIKGKIRCSIVDLVLIPIKSKKHTVDTLASEGLSDHNMLKLILTD